MKILRILSFAALAILVVVVASVVVAASSHYEVAAVPANPSLDAHHPPSAKNGNHRGDRHLRPCVHSAAASTQRLYVADGSHPLSSSSSSSSRHNQQQEQEQQQQQRDASVLASSPDWRTLRVQVNTTLVFNPTADLDVETGKPYSCGAVGTHVFAGGQDSGFECFDPTTGKRLFQNYCQLTCQANETLNSTLMERLKTEVESAISFLQRELESPSTDNTSIRVRSDPSASCGGMNISPPRQVFGKDLLVMVTARPTRQLGNVDAHAMACQVHEGSNRPVLIHLNINPIALTDPWYSTSSSSSVNSGLYHETLHQMVHALGMSNYSYPLFKHPDNRNKTYYEFSSSQFPTGPVSGAGIVVSSGGGAGSFVLDPSAIAAGEKIYFKGPNVARVAERYFKCTGGDPIQSNGIELENGGNSQTVTGVHWEKRILMEELLLGTPSPEMYFSAFTWAFLQDTGYLNVPRLQQQQYWDTTAMSWGREMGCGFLKDKCSKWGSDYFCSEPNTPGCGFDRSFMGLCDVQQWNNPVPSPYQYFTSNGGRKAGPDSLADYCPINRLVVQGKCTEPSNALVGDRKSKQGMAFGDTARCYVNRVISSSFSQPGGGTLTGCYESFCGGSANSNNAFIVVGKEAAPCSKDGEVIELFPPVRYNTGNFTVTTAGATLQLSYNYHGMVQCDSLVSYCAAGAAGSKNITIPTVADALPTIESVHPPWGDPTGGTTVTILGTDLSRCASAIVGGVALSEFVAINSTAIKGVLGNVGQTGGGPKPEDGTGDALVELQCYVSEVPVCRGNKGCIVARTKGVFNYSFTDPRIPLRSGDGIFSDFFDSVAGKVVGIVMCVVVIVILIVLARLCFKDGHKVGDKIEDVEGLDDDGEGDLSSPRAAKKKYQAPDTAAAAAGDGSGAAAAAAAGGADGEGAMEIDLADGMAADIEGLPYDDPEEMTVLI